MAEDNNETVLSVNVEIDDQEVTPEWAQASIENAVRALMAASEIVQAVRTGLAQEAYDLAHDDQRSEMMAKGLQSLGFEADSAVSALSLAGLVGMADVCLFITEDVLRHLQAIQYRNTAMVLQAMRMQGNGEAQG